MEDNPLSRTDQSNNYISKPANNESGEAVPFLNIFPGLFAFLQTERIR